MEKKDNKIILIEEDLTWVEAGISKLKRIFCEGSKELFSSEEYINLYTIIYNLCARKPPGDEKNILYHKYKEVVKSYLVEKTLPSIREKHNEFHLIEVANRWTTHKVLIRWLMHFFHYLDRFYIPRNFLPTLNEVGVTFFRDLVYEEVKVMVKDNIIVLIDKEREGEQIDRGLLKKTVDMFVELGLGDMMYYEDDFERHMIADTGNYYSLKASSWIVEDSCPDYMLKVEECFKKEKDRVSHYLHWTTKEKLDEKLQYELLVVYASQLIAKESSGCRVLLRDAKKDDLSRMFRLYHNIPEHLEAVADVFKKFIEAEGAVLVQEADHAAGKQIDKANNSEQESVLIWKIIKLHDKFMDYVKHCFQNHKLFHKGLKAAFEVFCNREVAGISSAELLAAFVDNILSKDGSHEEIDDTLDNVVKLLEYVFDKDFFAEFCRKKLARRLLLDRSVNDDLERSFLMKLKQQYGMQYTSNMEAMIKDMAMAKEKQVEFQDYLKNDTNWDGINFSVTVLATGFWPSYKSSEFFNPPAEMMRAKEVFNEFYQKRSKNKVLTWIYSLGSCQVLGRFQQKSIELIVSTYQAAILLLFNNADKLHYTEIMTQTNLTHEDLVRLLHSLSCLKYKILLKEPSTSTVSRTDSFEFNSKFTNKRTRIKLPAPTITERKKVTENLDRRHVIDATIVRIMKSKKTLTHQELMIECINQLHNSFIPDIKDIKKRVDDLINRSYLSRDHQNSNIYHYIA